MVARLKTDVERNILAYCLQLELRDGEPRPIIGLELAPIDPVTCTQERCEEGGKPGSREMFTSLGLDSALPEEK